MANAMPVAAARRRWDPVIRLTHWTVALAIVLNGLITEEGSLLHIYIGWAALAMLALRLMWGFIGTEEARFSAFPISISAVREHLSNLLNGVQREYVSHNPLGTLMVYALWGSLLVVTATGIGMTGSPFDPVAGDGHARYGSQEIIAKAAADGPYSRGDEGRRGDEDGDEDEGNEVLEEVHGLFANLLLVLAALHVGGVALESRLSGRNLAREMVTGRRGDTGG